jgi:hypothetical protein
MYIGEGGVTDIISWFRSNSSARWLGFFVGGSTRYDTFIDDVLRKGLAIDVISGSKIDLFLFGAGPRVNLRGSSSDVTVSVLPLTELHQRSEDSFDVRRMVITHISDVNRSAIESRKIAKASIVASAEVKEVLGLGTDDVPCLALLRRFDNEKLVLRTRDQADAEFIIEFLKALNTSLERFDRAQAMDIPTEGRLRQAEAVLPKIRIEEDVLSRNARRLQRTANELSIELAKAGVVVDPEVIFACFENEQIGELAAALAKLSGADAQARSVLGGTRANELQASMKSYRPPNC